MALEQETLWTHFRQELETRGYLLEEKLSKSNGKTSKSNTLVYKGTAKLNGAVAVPCVFKISTRFALDEMDMNPLEKLDELAERKIIITRLLAEVTPYIPKLLDTQSICIRDNTTPISMLVLEYVDKPNLQTAIDSGKAISETQARKTLEEVLSALDAAHTRLPQQVLHRDIKPSNILSDEEGGKLIDFNYSYIGEEGAASSTVLQNYGYYPLDTYEKQTASQDLVALGNVVIAAGYAKDISALRVLQGKNGLETIAVEGLPFSPKLKRFLQKLTAKTPAFRYQTAKQALEALEQLDKTSEEELERELTAVRRDERLEKLLERLQKEDELFEYNVSTNVREQFDDDALLSYLQKVYSKTEFVLGDPKHIERYIQIGDRAVKKGTYSQKSRVLPKDSEGIVNSLNKGKVLVAFGAERWEVDPIDLIVFGKHRSLRGDIVLEETFADKINGGLQLNHKVKYVGEKKVEYSGEHIPDGSEGVVANIFQQRVSDGARLHIVWLRKKGVIQEQRQFNNRQNNIQNNIQNHHYYEIATQPGIRYRELDIKLIRKNTIDFEKLYKECFNTEINTS